MRIVSGEFRGRTLHVPPGAATRPTSDRARQAIFNILEHAPWAGPLRDARVIDLFAGSGALGFEALSRGAARALFFDLDRRSLEAVEKNLERLGFAGKGRAVYGSAFEAAARLEPADLVFVDPPYDFYVE